MIGTSTKGRGTESRPTSPAATRDLHFGTQEMQDLFVEVISGAKGQKHTTLDAGRFIQDNKGEELAQILKAFIHDNPRR